MFICMHCLLQMIWWRIIFENVKWVAANAPLFGLIHGSPTCMNEGVVLVVIDVSWLCIKSDSFKFCGWEAIWVSSKVHHLEDEMMFLMEMCRSFKGSNSWCELQHDSDDYQLHVFRVLMERMKTFFLWVKKDFSMNKLVFFISMVILLAGCNVVQPQPNFSS